MFGNFAVSLSFLLLLVAAVSNADESVSPNFEIEDESRGILDAFQKRPTKLTSVHPTESIVTTTVFVTTTTVVESLATRYCATTSSVSGACRRRRGILEQPSLVLTDEVINQHEIELQPTKVLG